MSGVGPQITTATQSVSSWPRYTETPEAPSITKLTGMSPDAVTVRSSTYASPAGRQAARSSSSQRGSRMKTRTASRPTCGSRGEGTVRDTCRTRQSVLGGDNTSFTRRSALGRWVTVTSVRGGNRCAGRRRRPADRRGGNRPRRLFRRKRVRQPAGGKASGSLAAYLGPGVRIFKVCRNNSRTSTAKRSRRAVWSGRATLTTASRSPRREQASRGPAHKRVISACVIPELQATSTVHQSCSPVI